MRGISAGCVLALIIALSPRAFAQGPEGSPAEEEASFEEDKALVKGLKVVVVPATGPKDSGRPIITRTIAETLEKAGLVIADPRELKKKQAELGVEGREANTPKNLGRAAEALGAQYVVSTDISRKGWLYTARTILIRADTGEIQMDFRSGFYRPTEEGPDRGQRIGRKTVWKLARLVRESKALMPSWRRAEEKPPPAEVTQKLPDDEGEEKPTSSLFDEGDSSSSSLFDDSEDSGSSLFGASDEDSGGGGASEAQYGFQPTVRARIHLDASLAVDTRFDRRGEQVGELSLGAKLQVDGDISESVTFFAAPRFFYTASIDRDGNDRNILLLNTPEAAVTLALGHLHLKVGALVFNWGASDLIGPSDVINPVDLRRNAFGSDTDNKIPVLAAEAVFSLGDFTLRGVVQPFFTPSRFYLSGWDSSLALGLGLPSFDDFLDPDTSDKVLDQLVVTDRPPDRPDSASVAFRASGTFGDIDLAATFFHGWETLPAIRVDPSIVQLLGVVGSGIASGQPLDPSDPDVLPILLRINEALANGEAIFQGNFVRRTLFGLDGVLQVDPFIFKFDVAYTLKRLIYYQDSTPDTRPWLNAVVGFELTRWNFQVFVDGFVIAVLDVPAGQRLLYLEPLPEPGDAPPGQHTVIFPGATGVIRYTALDGDLEIELFGLGTFTAGDLLLSPSVRYRFSDHHAARVGAVFLEGRPGSYARTYGSNDQAFVLYEWRP